jgi:signal transduction histidine kinase
LDDSWGDTVTSDTLAQGEPGPGPADASDIAALRARLLDAQSANRLLEREVVQHRLAAEIARSQTRMLIRSLGVLAKGAHLDRFLGHVLKLTVQQLNCVGGTLWFPDPLTGRIRLHLEYLDGRIVGAAESHHPAALAPPPVGGKGVSTFPTTQPEIFLMSEHVEGMPEANRAYIQSLGVRALLTVPMNMGRQSIGWICLRSAKADPQDLESKIQLAEALANQATLAVQMARLSEQARDAAVLAERNRIARDIHDTLAQGFTGIVLNLEAACRLLSRQDSAGALEHVEHSRALARSCLDEARQSVRALRPEVSHEVDLIAALQEQVNRTVASGTRGQLTVSGAVRSLGAEVCSELVRIVQEGITNVIRHAVARTVEVRVCFEAGRLSLTISDDGVGFDTRRQPEGYGLRGMSERAQRLGADWYLNSTPGSGTEVRIVVRDHE